jgi:hypothetical protein
VTRVVGSLHRHRTGEAHCCRGRRQLNIQHLPIGASSEAATLASGRTSTRSAFSTEFDPKRTRQMIRLADGAVFGYVVPIFNMVTSTAKDSNGA